MNGKPPASQPTSQPWWKYGHVWLIIAGPLVVVIAGFVTLYLAVRTPDPVITPDYYRKGLELSRQAKPGEAGSLAPAVQARNHAATGGAPAAPQPER
ncbi:MAG: FixH family protein [Hylemonella sp.]